MDQSAFGSQSPGRLVAVRGEESLNLGGVPRRYRFSGLAFLPDPLPPKVDLIRLIGEVWPELDAARASLAELQGRAASLPNPHLLARVFRIQEAQASSRIENTIATAADVVLEDVGERADVQSREVLNYLKALEWGIQQDRPFAQWTTRQMHQTLLSGARGDDRLPGEYRVSQAYIQGDGEPGFAGARFVPPPAEHVQSSMDALERFLTDPGKDIPPLIAIALAHYQFEAIHPFSDGNGRVGRLLIHLALDRFGLLKRPLISISAFFDRHRQTYYDLLLRVSTVGDWASWIRFVCRACSVQAYEAHLRADRLLALRQDYLQRVTEPRSSVLLREIADHLFTRPAVRASYIRDLLNISHQQAQRHIDRLVQKGILKEMTNRSYDRVYLATEIIEVIETDLFPEADAPHA